ncbi:MAG: hypothetical protein M3R63_21545 [Actinomycetota bacterium]|nr:hypothetical protein [Actinomycetota bacterium]
MTVDRRTQILAAVAAVAAADPGLPAVGAGAVVEAVLSHPAVTQELATALAADPAVRFVGAARRSVQAPVPSSVSARSMTTWPR